MNSFKRNITGSFELNPDELSVFSPDKQPLLTYYKKHNKLIDENKEKIYEYLENKKQLNIRK